MPQSVPPSELTPFEQVLLKLPARLFFRVMESLIRWGLEIAESETIDGVNVYEAKIPKKK